MHFIATKLATGIAIATVASNWQCSLATVPSNRQNGTHVDELVEVTLTQVVQDCSFIEIGQVGHILNHLELEWVHLLHFVFLDCHLLQCVISKCKLLVVKCLIGEAVGNVFKIITRGSYLCR